MNPYNNKKLLGIIKRKAKKYKEIDKIAPSTRKNKKIDVFLKNGKKIAIGDSRYKDFQLYKQLKGLTFAKNRRRLYRIRHKKNAQKKGSPAFYAYHLLW